MPYHLSCHANNYLKEHVKCIFKCVCPLCCGFSSALNRYRTLYARKGVHFLVCSVHIVHHTVWKMCTLCVLCVPDVYKMGILYHAGYVSKNMYYFSVPSVNCDCSCVYYTCTMCVLCVYSMFTRCGTVCALCVPNVNHVCTPGVCSRCVLHVYQVCTVCVC